MSVPYLREVPEGVYFSVKVQPRASRNRIGDVVGQELKIFVTAPPVDSAANEALIELLADRLSCARSAIQLVRGQTSRHKMILVRGMTAEAILRKLSELSR